ncbi:MAG: GGDEF domain-containing protein [Burkholderiales bacterium]|nr:GGDEF domain-containing protein [Burkholderiales bacterium]
MALDFKTLLVVNAVNLILMAFVLGAIMRNPVSAAAASARASLVVQAIGWAVFMVTSIWGARWSEALPEGIFHVYHALGLWWIPTFSVACTSVSIWLMFRALQGWLGPRHGNWTMLSLAILTPLGYALAYDNYPVRVGWSNTLLAMQLLIVCIATLRPSSDRAGGWRWVIFLCALVMAGFTAARGILGAFYTQEYPSFTTPHPVNVLALLATNVSLVLVNLAVLVAWREEAEAQLRNHAYTDALTGLHNRHHWELRAPAVFDAAIRHGNDLSLLALDLDFFKRINDTHGHDEGDQVLTLFGQTILENLRSSDLAARIGGEEFVILLPQTDQQAARQFEARLRSAFLRNCERDPLLMVNFSAGLASLREVDTALTAFLARADRALYRAKEAGRGRLEVDV